MESLPFELAHAILLLVDARAIQEKFRLTAVSQYLRSAALASPLLWTSFRIASYRNAVLLPLLLARSSDAPLRVELDFTDFVNGPPVPAGTQRKVTRCVAQHFARIRELVLRYDAGTPAADVAPLLNKGLMYPELRHLAVFGTLPTLEMALSAPNLRFLQLQYAVPRDWDSVLGPSLEVLHLKFMSDAGVLVRVFERARGLQELALDTQAAADPATFDPFALRPPRSLRALALDMPYAEHDALSILRTLANAGVVPQTASVCVSPGQEPLLLEDVVAQLVRGTGPLVALDARRGSAFTLTDAAGRVRTAAILEAVYFDPGWDWAALWMALPALWTVRTIAFHTDMWEQFARSAGVWPALDELRITANRTEVYDRFRYDRQAEAWIQLRLVCAQIARIRVDVDPPSGDCAELAATILRVVQRITIERAEAVEVCVGTTTFGPDAGTHILNATQWLQFPVSKLSPGSYTLCRHCNISP